MRLYRPAPTLAFSRREASLARFDEAVAEAVAFGYAPVIRPAGGRAVVLDSDWLVMDLLSPEVPRRDNREVFTQNGELMVQTLRSLGVDARLGEVPGEYCPGQWSINARGRVKLVGTAQRVARGARLYAASIPLRASAHVAELLDRVNRILDLEWDPATLGDIESEILGVDDSEVEAALVHAFAGQDYQERSVSEILALRR